ncbi:MAG TPA: TetR/AcrR family transcriptional regulator [Streptosporangiaceae bacterium]|nr:TetR/AcrR family transcriptional regulator [Streptosporangiaceae bacterium]
MDQRLAEFAERLGELDQHSGHSGRPGGDPGPRGRDRHRPMLTRDDIVAAAIGIADRYGSDAVSMRKIAQVLQAGAMSLYWHLASKEHLLELMLDAINGEVYVPEPTGDWRADLRAQACSTRSVLRRHPWVVDFFSSRPPLGPQTLQLLERMLGILDTLGLDLATSILVFQTVNTYVSGAVIREFQEIRTQREHDEFASEDPDFFAKLEEWKDKLALAGKFDHFVRMLDDGVDPDAQETRDERFEFGLDCMLDGIAARLTKDASG